MAFLVVEGVAQAVIIVIRLLLRFGSGADSKSRPLRDPPLCLEPRLPPLGRGDVLRIRSQHRIDDEVLHARDASC